MHCLYNSELSVSGSFWIYAGKSTYFYALSRTPGWWIYSPNLLGIFRAYFFWFHNTFWLGHCLIGMTIPERVWCFYDSFNIWTIYFSLHYHLNFVSGLSLLRLSGYWEEPLEEILRDKWKSHFTLCKAKMTNPWLGRNTIYCRSTPARIWALRIIMGQSHEIVYLCFVYIYINNFPKACGFLEERKEFVISIDR